MTEQNGLERSSATDELRAELTRRGVEWWLSDDPCCEYIITHWCVEPFQWTAIEGEKDLWLNAGIAGHEPLTPEQAIAATLGPREQPPYDELIEALRRDWDIEASWDGLRRFWYVGLTDEGVRKRDEREATLGRGTCHDTGESRVFRCSECGFGIEDAYVEDERAYPPEGFPRFCPWCGAKVVDE